MSPALRLAAAAVVCAVLAAGGCSRQQPAEPASTGGSGGLQGSSGGSGGIGGAPAVGSGGNEGDGGSGGIDPGWIDAEVTWRPLTFEPAFEGFRLSEGIPSKMHFPRLAWEPCGPACEMSSLTYGRSNFVYSMSIAHSAEGSFVYADAVHALMEREVLVKRIVRLSDGATVGALRMVPPDSGEFVEASMHARYDSPMIVMLNDRPPEPDGVMYAAFDAFSSSWDFKAPVSEASGRRDSLCDVFDLDVSPPVLYFACGDSLEVMDAPGSREMSVIPDSSGTYSGAGNFGLAVWSEISRGESNSSSSIRGRNALGELFTLAEIEGAVCAIAVGQENVIGITGDDMSGRCPTGVLNSRFFLVPKGGGRVVEGPVLSAESLVASKISTWGDYAVANVRRPPDPDKPGSGWAILLIRLSDWKMRVIERRSLNESIQGTTVALDGQNLYFHSTDAYSERPANQLYGIYRYSLDRFDEIGVPFEPIQ